tara:strand:- start:601 stop:816 length:216 start_codon:yes stop_codon:yes gene_type:complete
MKEIKTFLRNQIDVLQNALFAEFAKEEGANLVKTQELNNDIVALHRTLLTLEKTEKIVKDGINEAKKKTKN